MVDDYRKGLAGRRIAGKTMYLHKAPERMSARIDDDFVGSYSPLRRVDLITRHVLTSTIALTSIWIILWQLNSQPFSKIKKQLSLLFYLL